MEPAAPSALPVLSTRRPDSPAEAKPEVNATSPEVSPVLLPIVTVPLEPAVLVPETIARLPPDSSPYPAATDTSPPWEPPMPAERAIAPPTPTEFAPDVTPMLPAVPADDEPLWMSTSPPADEPEDASTATAPPVAPAPLAMKQLQCQWISRAAGH